MLKGIDQIAIAHSKPSKLSEWQATYKTSGDFRISTYKGRKEVILSITSGMPISSTTETTATKLPEFRSLISKAKEKIETLKSEVTGNR